MPPHSGPGRPRKVVKQNLGGTLPIAQPGGVKTPLGGPRGRLKGVLLAAIVVSAFDWGGQDFFPFAALTVICGGLLFWRALKNLRAGDRLFPRTGLNVPLGLFSLVCLASLTYSIDRFSTGYNLVKVMIYGVMFFAAVRSFSRKDIEGLFLSVFVWTLLLSGFGIWQYLTGRGQFPEENACRAQAVFSTPNIFSSFLLLSVFPAMAGFLMTPKGWVKAGLGFGVAITYLALLATYSRAGIASFAVCAVVFALLLIRYAPTHIRRGMVHLGVILAAATVLFLAHNSLVMKGSFARRATGVASDNLSPIGRWGLWKVAHSAWKDHPVGGTGLGTFSLLLVKYRPMTRSHPPTNFVHNDYLQILCEMGVVGLLALGWLLLAALGQGWKCMKAALRTKTACLSAGIVSGLLGLFVHSFFDFSLLVPGTMCLAFLVMGCQTAISRETRRKDEVSAEKRAVGRTGRFLRRAVCAAGVAVSAIVVLLVLSVGFGDIETRKAARLLEKGKGKEATRHMERASRLCPYVPRYHLNLARSYSALSRLGAITEFAKKAGKEYRKAVELSPHDVSAWVGLGIFLFRRGTGEGLLEAARCFERARELAPSSVAIRHKLGLTYLRLGRTGDARRQFMFCKQNDPGCRLLGSRIERLLVGDDLSTENLVSRNQVVPEGPVFGPSDVRGAGTRDVMGKVD